MGRVFDDAPVLSVVDYGLFVKLRDGVEGFVAKEELDEEGQKAKPGDVLRCEVMSLDTSERRIFLTSKNIGAERPAPAPRKAHQEDSPKPAGTLGDLIKEKLGGKLELK
jgi:small subunit ribosomal protein S1